MTGLQPVNLRQVYGYQPAVQFRANEYSDAPVMAAPQQLEADTFQYAEEPQEESHTGRNVALVLGAGALVAAFFAGRAGKLGEGIQKFLGGAAKEAEKGASEAAKDGAKATDKAAEEATQKAEKTLFKIKGKKTTKTPNSKENFKTPTGKKGVRPEGSPKEAPKPEATPETKAPEAKKPENTTRMTEEEYNEFFKNENLQTTMMKDLQNLSTKKNNLLKKMDNLELEQINLETNFTKKKEAQAAVLKEIQRSKKKQVPEAVGKRLEVANKELEAAEKALADNKKALATCKKELKGIDKDIANTKKRTENVLDQTSKDQRLNNLITNHKTLSSQLKVYDGAINRYNNIMAYRNMTDAEVKAIDKIAQKDLYDAVIKAKKMSKKDLASLEHYKDTAVKQKDIAEKQLNILEAKMKKEGIEIPSNDAAKG